MAKNAYTQKTLARLKALGWTYYKAEHWQMTTNAPGHNQIEGKTGKPGRNGVRIDAFGFGDIDAIRPAPAGFPFPLQSLLIQSTSAGCISARKKKILTECRNAAQDVLNSGRAIEIWGWHKKTKDGLTQAGKPRKQKEWVCKIIIITPAHFQEAEQCVIQNISV